MHKFTCNCEHVKHFPIGEHEPNEWADIPRDGHKYLETVIAEHAPYQVYMLSDVCQSCYVNCLRGTLN